MGGTTCTYCFPQELLTGTWPWVPQREDHRAHCTLEMQGWGPVGKPGHRVAE